VDVPDVPVDVQVDVLDVVVGAPEGVVLVAEGAMVKVVV
jgi:hypothetical protein